MLYCARLAQCIPTYVTWFSDVNIDALTPRFSLLSEYSSTAVVWFINSPIPMHVFSDYILLFLFFCFTFIFHNPTASCWLTVCLSVVQILIFHVCSFFLTYTSCIQRLYKGQFKILQSDFGFHYKMSLAAQYKIFNTVRVHVHLWQEHRAANGLFYISCRCTYKSISLCIFNLKCLFRLPKMLSLVMV